MKNNKVLIYINGKQKLVNINKTLLAILEMLSINNNFIAVEVNKEVIPKSLYSNKKILNGDNIEILQMIGGG